MSVQGALKNSCYYPGPLGQSQQPAAVVAIVNRPRWQPAAVAPAPLLLFPVNCVQPRPPLSDNITRGMYTHCWQTRGGGLDRTQRVPNWISQCTAIIYCLVPIPHRTTTPIEGGEGDMTDACSSSKQLWPSAGRMS